MWSNDNILSFLPPLSNHSALFQPGKKETSPLSKAWRRLYRLEERGACLAGDFYFEISWQKLIRRIM